MKEKEIPIDGGWICKICKNACAGEWDYCPYCGDPGPDEDEE